MRTRELEVRTADGRRLFARVTGSTEGPVVFSHTGTPGTRYLFEGDLREGELRGLRHVCYSRPGYEGSDRRPGRSFADCAPDVADIADALGAEEFYVVGYSGGGPHALACAALLPDRVISAAALASFSPEDAEGLDWMAGAPEDNLREFEAVRAGDAALERYLRDRAARMGAVESVDQLRAAFGSLICDADYESLVGPFLEYQLLSLQRVARDEIWGWFDDNRAICSDWGFDPARISVPTTIWHGGDDKVVPVADGKWVADRVPTARFHLLPREGHLSLALRYGELLDELIEIGRRGNICSPA